MEEPKRAIIFPIIKGLFTTILSLYTSSMFIFFFYFNYFATGELHPFSEVNAAGKAIVWPYILYKKKSVPAVKEPLPKDIEYMMYSFEDFAKAADLMAQMEKEGYNKVKVEQYGQYRSLVQSGLDKAEKVNFNELNKIYPEWGTHIRDELVAGSKLFIEAIETKSEMKLEIVKSKSALWDSWLMANDKEIAKLLKDRYSFTPYKK